MIATNAQKILDARMQGFAPNEMILVSLIGNISEPNYTVLARPDAVYDWKWARGLRLGVYINSAIQFRPALLAIAKAAPDYLCVWDVDSERGARVFLKPSHPAHEDKPVRSWEWVLDFSSWQDCDNEDFKKWN